MRIRLLQVEAEKIQDVLDKLDEQGLIGRRIGSNGVYVRYYPEEEARLGRATNGKITEDLGIISEDKLIEVRECIRRQPKEDPVVTPIEVEVPKVETPTFEPKVVEAPKAEEPKVEPKVEEVKPVEPKVEEPKVETPKEEPKKEEPKVEEVKE